MSGVRFECVLTVGVTTNDPFDSHQLGPKWESPGTNQFSNAHDQHPRLFPLLLVFLAVVLAAWWAGKVWGRKKEARRSVGMVQTNLKYRLPSNVSPPRTFLRLRSAMAARPTIRAGCVLAVFAAVWATHLAAEPNQVRSCVALEGPRPTPVVLRRATVAHGVAPLGAHPVLPHSSEYYLPNPPRARARSSQASTCHRARSLITST